MNISTRCCLRRALGSALVVAGGLAYAACSPIKPLLTRNEAKARRVQAQESLSEKQKALAAKLAGKPTPSIDSVVTAWAKHSQNYEDQLGQIGLLRQPPNTPLTTSSIIFDPFGAGTSGPRRVRYGRQLQVEAININPFKYDVELASKAYSYVYAVPAAPSTNLPPPTDTSNPPADPLYKKLDSSITLLPSTASIQVNVREYDRITQKLEQLYRLDTRPAADDVLLQDAQKLLAPNTLTAANFARYPIQQDSSLTEIIRSENRSLLVAQKTVKKLLGKAPLNVSQKFELSAEVSKLEKAAHELASAKNLLAQVRNTTGGADATKQAAATKKAEVLGQLLLALRDEPNPRFRVQVPTKGDEMDTKLKLTVRADYLIPPGRAAGKLLAWETTTQVTHRFRVSASAGAYVTGLRDYTFGLFEDSSRVRRRTNAASPTDTTTALGYKRDKRVARLNTEEGPRIGFTGLTHFHYRLRPTFDAALSLGLGAQEAGLQVLAGVTVLTGGEKQRVCLTVGGVGGRVSRLSGGYQEGQRVGTVVSVVPTQSVNKVSWFAALTYNLTAARE